MFSESKAFKRNHFVNYFEEDSDEPEVHVFKTKFTYNDAVPGGTYRLDDEVCYVAKLSKTLREEVDKFFGDQKGKTITFHGLFCLPDGTITMKYN
jgi:hypothetical protein